MITADYVALLRCPLDPKRLTGLVLEEEHKLYCVGCRVRFPTKDGFANMVPEEAELPEGCAKMEQLPCRKRR